MKVGYARVSSESQNLERQIEALENAGVKRIYQEKKSGTSSTDRRELKKLLKFIREDDTVVIVSLDRLSRDYNEIAQIIKHLHDVKAGLIVLDNELLSFKPDSKRVGVDQVIADIMLTLMSFISENERQKIRERQREGIEMAKRKGRYKGQQKTYSPVSNDLAGRHTWRRVVDELQAGDNTNKAIAEQNGISEPTLYRIKDEWDRWLTAKDNYNGDLEDWYINEIGK